MILLGLLAIGAIISYVTIYNLDQRTNIDQENDQNIVVKSLTLKYSLIDTAQEMYYVNVEPMGYFTEEFYKSKGNNTYQHYVWLKDTYNELPANMKIYLSEIYGSGKMSAWPLLDSVKELDDNANIDEVVYTLDQFTKDLPVNQAINNFYPYFYDNYFKDYLANNKPEFDKKAKEINKELANNNFDLLEYMEETSGISFDQKYKIEFYYELAPIGAYGLSYDNVKISTIQRDTKYETIYNAPFHEFSHSLFKTFTESKEFYSIAEKMKTDEYLYNEWDTKFKNNYSWTGFLEENLVEGFADFLSYKYYGNTRTKGIYVYDFDYYNYLMEIDFNPEEISLKEVSIDFYEGIFMNLK